MAKNNFAGKVVTIDGVDYKLVEVKAEDQRNKVIISMEMPFGLFQKVFNRYDKNGEPFPLAEGDYDNEGHVFHVKYVAEDEVAENVGKPISELSLDESVMALLSMMVED